MSDAIKEMRARLAHVLRPDGDLEELAREFDGAAERFRCCASESNGWGQDADRFTRAAQVVRQLAAVQVAPEIVICAAIKMPDGYIVRGHRHHHCLQTASSIPRYAEMRVSGNDQGFITSRNRYVDRAEGLALQIAAGIRSVDPNRNGDYHPEILFSEDLY